MTTRMVARACMKGLALFIIFNVIYGLIDPVKTGQLPTLYNMVFPGRVRFMPYYEYDAYRMVSDHVIMTARPETFNIVILGSSEMWGARILPDDTGPAQLDQSGLIAADGRPVRVYNLAHPTPFALKDLILLDAALEKKIPIDLVVLSTFDSSLSFQRVFSPVARANTSFSIHVLEHYDVRRAVVLLDFDVMEQWTPFFLRLWRDRDALMIWATSQTRGLGWSLMRTDYDLEHPQFVPGSGLTKFDDTLELNRTNPPPSADFLYAFKRMSLETGIPVIILASPVPFEKNEFEPWIREQTAAIGLPLIDCWRLFRSPSDFEDPFHLYPGPLAHYMAVLAKHLSDPTLNIRGLPLQLPPAFAMPSDSCAVYPLKTAP